MCGALNVLTIKRHSCNSFKNQLMYRLVFRLIVLRFQCIAPAKRNALDECVGLATKELCMTRVFISYHFFLEEEVNKQCRLLIQSPLICSFAETRWYCAHTSVCVVMGNDLRSR